MTTLNIPAGEIGVVRLFAVSRPIPAMSVALKRQPKSEVIAELLGTQTPEDTAELFPISDLTGVGLPAYLMDGYAIPPGDIARDRAKLDALDGYVLLLFSAAFDEATTLSPHRDLTLIGSYSEPAPEIPGPPFTAQAAQPYTGTPNLTPAEPLKGRAGGAAIAAALFVLAALIFWWALR